MVGLQADKGMDDVVELMTEKYSNRSHSWFGHPERQDNESK